ncbi:molybdate ABC transporter substrate-binding protein [Syntrophomonas curvata]
MRKTKLGALLLAAILIVGCLTLVGCGNSPQSGKQPVDPSKTSTPAVADKGDSLTVYSGAGLRVAMDEIGQAFEQKYGVKVNYNYAGCAQLLSQMELSKQGDVFVGGSLNDMEIATQKGFTSKYYEVVYHIPAIGVPKGNPAQITCLADMAKPGVKLVLGDEQSNAIGKKGAKIFAKNGLQEGVNKNVVARDATVNEIVTHLAMKQGDAGLIWEDNGFGAKDIEVVSIPPEQNVIDKVPVCVLSFSGKTELAQKFADYVISPEGKALFVKHGFKPIE